MNTSDTAQATAPQPVEDRMENWLDGGDTDTDQNDAVNEPDAPAEDAEAQSELSEDETPELDADEAEEDGADDDEDAAKDDDESDDSDDEELVYTVKIDGEEMEVPASELVSGYQRQQDYTRKTQELAEARREHQAEAEAVSQERQQYSQLLQALSQQLESQMQQEPNWDEIYQRNPAEYVRVKAQWDDMKERQQAAQAEMQRVAQLQQQETQVRMQERLGSEREQMLRAVPEWKDGKKFDAAKKAIREYGKSLGFSDEELGQVYDHRAVVALWKASQYDALVSKKPEAKRRDSPKSAKAGSSQTSYSSNRKYKAQRQRLANSGSLDDAAKLFETLI